jgi:dolichol-phosphate mannosyltransferase
MIKAFISSKKALIFQFFKFGVVGAIGTVINLIVLYSFTEYLGIYYMISAIAAFVVAATSNFIFNKIWTFREVLAESIIKKYVKFFIVSVIALVVNLLLLYTFTEFLGLYYIISQIIAIIITFLINFAGNKIWTFSR